MLYSKIQPQSFLSSGEEGITAILFNGVKPFDQTVNILSTEGHMWNLMKNVQEVSEKKTFKNFTILYMYIAQEEGQITPNFWQ